MAFLPLIFPVDSLLLQSETDSPDQDSVHSVIGRLMQEDFSKVVIAGPDLADKTSLVFQAAVSMAASEATVTHICTHRLKKLPVPVHGMRIPEPNTMRKVDFLYLEDVKELISWCAERHTKPTQPNLIIVEDILTYASQIDEGNIEHSLARLCAMISDTASWIAQHNKIKGCPVLLTAPARASSLEHVLTQFDFRIVTYQGPQKGDANSHLSVSSDEAKVKISFCRQKECILMQEVSGTLKNT